MALIGLISDVHASPEPVAEALAIFSRAGVDQVLCAGDIAGYMDQLEQTITLLVESRLPHRYGKSRFTVPGSPRR